MGEINMDEYIGEWVDVDGLDGMWYVSEIGVSEERMQEISDSGALVGMTMPVDDGEPFDLLQNGDGYALISRGEWHARDYMPDPHTTEL